MARRRRPIGALTFAALAMLLGIIAGVGAFVFRALIAGCHNLLYLGRFSPVYDANVHGPASPWGWAVAFVPVVGSFAVVFLVKNFAPEARGHGVPEVMDAIYYEKGLIRPIVAVVKSVASAISIGSGGSVGREGPIIQIGAAFASASGRLAGASTWQMPTLVAAGGAAGIAATFNTPIGGVLFAVEVLMHEVSVRTLVPVALATATATYVGRRLLGSHPAFEVPAPVTPVASGIPLLVAHIGLGFLTACLSVAFIRGLYGSEDMFERLFPKREYLRHACGMLLVGLIGAVLWRTTGHLYVEGVGYAAIEDVLSGALRSVAFLLALMGLKLVATCVTLGSGASGGIFSPSLFLGATLGAAYAMLLRAVFPSLPADPAAFALAGMAGVVAGATGAVLTAIVMIFEMTLDYSVVLPMTVTAAVSFGLRRSMSVDSIYTMKLSRRGHRMPEALQSNVHLVRRVSDLPVEATTVLNSSATLADVPLGEGAPEFVVLVESNRIAGYLTRQWMSNEQQRIDDRALSEVARRDFVSISDRATLQDLLARMTAARATIAVVLRTGPDLSEAAQVSGVISQAGLAVAIAKGLELFAD